MDKVKQSLRAEFSDIYYWTDSSIPLHWLAAEPNRWQVFVANRVSMIQDLTENNQWRHIGSKENPADSLSGGLSLGELNESNLWWKGPRFLSSNTDWPQFLKINITNEIPDTKGICLTTTNNEHFDLLQKYSSFSKLKHIVAYCLRFAWNSQHKDSRRIAPLSVDELGAAENVILKITQRDVFEDDIEDMKKSGQVKRRSKLVTLSPLLDKNGLIRVGGSLKNANIPYEQKHPIVLPNKHHITKILIEEQHVRNLHAGPQNLLSIQRLRYWPVAAKGLVRKIVQKCVRCYRANPKIVNQLMGNLPNSRLQSTRPFLTCGVDFGGPFMIRESLRRGRMVTKKCYMAVFVCFSTKAVHIELVSDLTSNAFVATVRRFVSRRGLCKDIYSDNGTNFVATNNHLKKLYESLALSEPEILRELGDDRITWHFIPARTPHFRGLWEACIKSIKYHLKRVAENSVFTYEEMHTLLCQIEACLNSRPLVPLSTDPNDFSTLTPSHFLIGDSLVSLPEEDLLDIPTNKLNRWQHIQKVKQHFCRKWSNDYLSTLQQRTKWYWSSSPKDMTGALVLLKDESVPPLR